AFGVSSSPGCTAATLAMLWNAFGVSSSPGCAAATLAVLCNAVRGTAGRPIREYCSAHARVVHWRPVVVVNLENPFMAVSVRSSFAWIRRAAGWCFSVEERLADLVLFIGGAALLLG